MNLLERVGSLYQGVRERMPNKVKESFLYKMLTDEGGNGRPTEPGPAISDKAWVFIILSIIGGLFLICRDSKGADLSEYNHYLKNQQESHSLYQQNPLEKLAIGNYEIRF